MKTRPSGTRLLDAAFACLALMPFMLVWLRGGAELCMGAVALLFLIRSAMARDWAWLHSPFAKLALITWAWVVLAVSPLAVEVVPSLERAAGWLRYPLFFLAVTQWVLRDARRAEWLAWIIAALLAFICADTLLQYVRGVSLFGNVPNGERLSGPFNSVKVGIYTARMMFPVLGFLIWRGLVRQRKRQVVLCVLGMLVLCLMILLSGERSALLVSLMACALAGVISALAYPRARVVLLSGGAALALALAGLWATQPVVQRRVEMLHDHLAHFAESPYGQVSMASFTLAREHWLHGVGLHDFQAACEAERIAEHCEMHAHNPYMEWLVEGGIGGLACFLGLIVLLSRQPLRLLRRRDHYRPVMAAFGLSTLLVHFFPFMFVQSTVSNWPAMVLWLSLALNAAFMARAEAA